MDTKSTGAAGEETAVKYLEKRGYKILDRNFFVRGAGGPKIVEIDIIAKKKGTIIFAEVKTLKEASGQPFLAQDKVNGEKLRKIAMAAEIWLSKRKMPLNCKQQIDVIALELLKDNRPNFIRALFGSKYRIAHIENVSAR